MLTEKEIIGKLYEAAEQFRMHMEARRYPQAKHCYETAVNVAVFVELDEAESQKLFGIRGERGDHPGWKIRDRKSAENV